MAWFTHIGTILPAVRYLRGPARNNLAPRKSKLVDDSVVRRLGYSSETRLLIVHADDLAITHAVNAACFNALSTGLVNSASLMVPGPWFAEAAAFARSRADIDIGIHLTLTSERSTCRWGPIAPRNKVASLIDRDGYFHRTWTSEIRIKPREVEVELRSQIEMAYAAGLQPTHLDSHQLRLRYNGQSLFEIYVRLGREYNLPILIGRDWLAESPSYRQLLDRHDILIDRIVTIDPSVQAEQWPEFYRHAIATLPFGVTQLLIHPGLDDAELRAFSADSPLWGSEWRQRDYDFFTSDEFKRLLAIHGVQLITWREIGKRLLNR